jgi:DNA polymerase III subunit epsilon
MELKLKKPIVFLDLETTGINIVADRIVEICLLKIFPDNTQLIKTYRVNPTIPIPYPATMIHGIKDEDVKDCPTFASLSGTVFNFISDCDLAGYNSIKFDIPMLVEEFFRAGIDYSLKNVRIIDVQNIFHKMEQRNLVAAYKFYCGKELIGAHGAEADTIATYEVLKAQLDKYENTEYTDRKGNKNKPVVNDIKALNEFSYKNNNADLAGHIIFNEKEKETSISASIKAKTLKMSSSKSHPITTG